MVRRATLAGAAAAALLLPAAPVTEAAASGAPAGGAADRCAALAAAGAFRGVQVDAAQLTPAAWTSPAVSNRNAQPVAAGVCRVQGRIDGDVGFEVWLPVDGWNGRFLGTGVGGNAGYLNYTDMARGAGLGFAAASTDTGHSLEDVSWVADPRKAANYANVAHHRLAEVSKAMLARFYGEPARHAYFIGCSGGGRQALKVVQDFPADYDGVIAGAPGLDLVTLSARHLGASLHALRDPDAAVSPAAWDAIGQAAVKACDADDGVTDGVVANPAACRFDPASLACGTTASSVCLTPKQLATVQAISAPLTVGGRDVDPGLLPGVTPRPGPPPALARSIFGHLAHGDANWNPIGFDPDKDVPPAWKGLPTMAAEKTDVGAFAKRGGKLIVYHGLIDPATLPQPTIAYVEAAKASVAKAGGPDFARLYLAPGMLHCQGGPGADRFGQAGDRITADDPRSNALSALVRWVEEGQAPQDLRASKIEAGRTIFTRKLCPHPQAAVYNGVGDADSADSFVCRAPADGDKE